MLTEQQFTVEVINRAGLTKLETLAFHSRQSLSQFLKDAYDNGVDSLDLASAVNNFYDSNVH